MRGSMRSNVFLLAIVCPILLAAIAVSAAAPAPFGVRPLPSAAAFASGGFGGGSAKGTKKKKKQKKSGTKKKAAAPAAGGQPNLFTPDGRMEHMRSRIEAADVSPMAKLSLMRASGSADGQLALDVDPNSVCVVDNFLGKDLITALRAEAESLVPTMVPSQSTRWDEESQTVVPYEKVGVLSTQIEGGAAGYEVTPRLVEYIVTLTANLSNKLNTILPPSHQLSGAEQTNKLAVCLGGGSMYDKHIDNLGGGEQGVGDRRKLTALLYLQPPGSHDGQPEFPNENVEDDPRGGYFRAFDVPEDGEVISIAPRGDRLIMFWSDSLVHDVSPSFTPAGDADQRLALTVWFVAGENGKIRATDAEVEERHFGTG